MSKELLKVVIRSNGAVIGSITPAQFRAASYGAPIRASLSELVEKFNEWKASIGEPERVEVALVK